MTSCAAAAAGVAAGVWRVTVTSSLQEEAVEAAALTSTQMPERRSAAEMGAYGGKPAACSGIGNGGERGSSSSSSSTLVQGYAGGWHRESYCQSVTM
jgi:hypothetical protein